MHNVQLQLGVLYIVTDKMNDMKNEPEPTSKSHAHIRVLVAEVLGELYPEDASANG